MHQFSLSTWDFNSFAKKKKYSSLLNVFFSLNICNLYLLILTQLINPHQKDIYLHKKFTVYVYPIFAQIKRSIMKVICSKLCVFIITELHRRRHSVISPTIATWWSRTRFNRMEFPPRGRRGNNVHSTRGVLWLCGR